MFGDAGSAELSVYGDLMGIEKPKNADVTESVSRECFVTVE